MTFKEVTNGQFLEYIMNFLGFSIYEKFTTNITLWKYYKINWLLFTYILGLSLNKIAPENWCQRARHVSHNFGRILFPEMLLPKENVAISRCLWCKDEGCNFSRNSENMKACIKTASI